MSLGIEQRKALNLLARSPHGHTESTLLAHGFPTATLGALLRDGLIIAEREPAYLNEGLAEARPLANSDRFVKSRKLPRCRGATLTNRH
jgi:hypothetical protein